MTVNLVLTEIEQFNSRPQADKGWFSPTISNSTLENKL